jgi:hypothetical protein
MARPIWSGSISFGLLKQGLPRFGARDRQSATARQ